MSKITAPSAMQLAAANFKGFLQQPWRISQWPPHKGNQHECSQPKHRRVEEPFLMRVRHFITNRQEHQHHAELRLCPS